jgi:hypothetical protein
MEIATQPLEDGLRFHLMHIHGVTTAPDSLSNLIPGSTASQYPVFFVSSQDPPVWRFRRYYLSATACVQFFFRYISNYMSLFIWLSVRPVILPRSSRKCSLENAIFRRKESDGRF